MGKKWQWESSAKKKGQNKKHKTKAGKKQQLKSQTPATTNLFINNKNANLADNESKECESIRK